MRSLVRAAIFVAVVAGTQSFGKSPISLQDSKETGAVTGRVTVDSRPAQGVVVLAAPSSRSNSARALEEMSSAPKSLKATTDSDGRYRLEGLPAGDYGIVAATPALISTGAEPVKRISIAAGATSEGVDFSLSRGGVITGKITDSNNQPLIAEEIRLKPVEPSKPGAASRSYSPFGQERMYYTDDRGIYRIYGIRPGRYFVSSGSSQVSVATMLSKRPKRIQTYYPGVTDEARARIVEVIAGAEATGVDIRLVAADKGFTVSGRVIDSETGRPIADAMVACAPAARKALPNDSDDGDLSGVIPTMATTNARGEFRLDALAPGSYDARVESLGVLTGASGFYADPIKFEVLSANIEKLEIKVHQGASISGGVVVENADSADASGQLIPFMLYVIIEDPIGRESSNGAARVAGDGSFRISGLKPGKAKIAPATGGSQNFSLLRVERDGVDLRDGIDVPANEQITGVRVVVTPANCVIRGHVTIQGGPPDSLVWVSARPLDSSISDGSGVVRVDSKGDFVLENLGPGDYEIVATTAPEEDPEKRRPTAKLTVTVTHGAPAQANLVLNLSPPGK